MYVSLHPGHCRCGPGELGGWPGADHAHSAGSGSLAYAQRGHVSGSALPASNGVRRTGCGHPGHLWHLQRTRGQNQQGGCGHRPGSLLVGTHAVPSGSHPDPTRKRRGSSEERGESPLLSQTSVFSCLVLLQWSVEPVAHRGTPRRPVPGLPPVPHAARAGAQPADDFLHLQEHPHRPAGALPNLRGAVRAAGPRVVDGELWYSIALLSDPEERWGGGTGGRRGALRRAELSGRCGDGSRQRGRS